MLPPYVRYAGPGLLLILLLAAVLIALFDLSGRPSNTASRVSGGVAVVLGLAGASLFATVQSAGTKPSNRIDERSTERNHSLLAIGIACAIAGFSVIIALAVPVTALIILAAAAAWVLAWWPRQMRRLSTTTGVLIERDTALVFGFLSDFRTQLTYVPFVASVEKLTDGPIGLGTQFRTRTKLPKGVYEGVEQITDYQPTTRYASTLVSSRHPNAGTAAFEPAPGGTRVTFHFESELSHASALLGMGPMRWLLQRRMVDRRMKVWARVKQILESETQPTT